MKLVKRIVAPFGKSGNIYLFGAITQGLSPIVLTPFLTRGISREDFGQLTYLNSISLIFSVFMSFGIPFVISRSYILEKNLIAKLDKLINIYVLNSLGISIIFFSLYLGFSQKIYIYLAIFFLYSIYQIGLPVLRARGLAIKFAFYSVLNTFFGNLMILLFIKRFSDVFILFYVGTIISSLIGFFFIYKKSATNITFNFLFSIIRTGLPVIPHMLSMIALVNIDKVIFASKTSDANTGFLQILMLIGLSPIFILSALNHAWLNQVLEQLQESSKRAMDSINKSVLNLFYICFLLFIVIFFFKDYFVIILNPFIEINTISMGAITIAASSSFLYIIYLANTHILTWKKKFWVLGVTSPLAVLSQSIIMWLLIDQYLYLSAALAFGVALTIQLILLEGYMFYKKFPSIIDLKFKISSLSIYWILSLIFISLVNS